MLTFLKEEQEQIPSVLFTQEQDTHLPDHLRESIKKCTRCEKALVPKRNPKDSF